MPAGDRTGPNGMGPMTGRGAGYCAGYNAPGFANGGPGFRGWGRGGGRGWRHRFFATGLPGWLRANLGFGASGGAAPAPPNEQQELDALMTQARQFDDALDSIRKRIEEIEARQTKG